MGLRRTSKIFQKEKVGKVFQGAVTAHANPGA